MNNVMVEQENKLRMDGLYLFKSLIKTGCEWQGDIFSQKWAECLFYTKDQEERVLRDLEGYEEGVHYRLKDGAIYIC